MDWQSPTDFIKPWNKFISFKWSIYKQNLIIIVDFKPISRIPKAHSVDITATNPPRIVFFFTVHMNTLRHIARIVKRLYHANHFYYIHVDAKSVQLRDKLEKIVTDLNRNGVINIRMADFSMSPIWAGSSLLFLHLRVLI